MGSASPGSCSNGKRKSRGHEATQGRMASPPSGPTADGSGHQQSEHETFLNHCSVTFALRKIPVCLLLPYFSKENKHLCTQLLVVILCPCIKRPDLRPEHFTFHCLFSSESSSFPKEKQKIWKREEEVNCKKKWKRKLDKNCEGKREEKWAGKLDEK